MAAKLTAWQRITLWAFRRLPPPLRWALTSRRGRNLLGSLFDAERRRAGWPEVEAHMRGVSLSDEQIAPFKAEYIRRLHGGR